MTSKSSFGHVIDGEEVGSLDGATFDDIDPFLREPWAEIALGDRADAERAIAAARKAFDEGPWPRMGFAERGAILHRLADLMEENATELAMADTRDMGKPIDRVTRQRRRALRVELPVLRRSRPHVHGQVLPMDTGHDTYTRFGPAGVVAAIAPWNFSMMLRRGRSRRRWPGDTPWCSNLQRTRRPRRP